MSYKNKSLFYVLTPGGYRRHALVKHAPKKGKKRVVNFDVFKKIEPSESAIVRKNLLEDEDKFVNHFGPPTADILNPHWVAFSGWSNTTGNPIKRFSAKLVVPPAPQNINHQTIFIFIGIQNSYQILQPVLQWGLSGMGGGNYWSVGSCFAAGQADPVRKSESMTRVQSGQELTAFIEMTDSSTQKFHYRCYFDGFNNSELWTAAIPELKYCCVTLESYGIRYQNNYPGITETILDDVEVRDSNQLILPPWKSPLQNGPYGEHATLTRDPGLPDQIHLYYA